MAKRDLLSGGDSDPGSNAVYTVFFNLCMLTSNIVHD